MRIAFYLGRYGNYYDKLITTTTFSRFSHCEIVFSDGQCASSSIRDGGIRFKRLNLDDHWEIFDLSYNNYPVSPFDESVARDWFNEHIGDKYDLRGAIGSLFHINLSSKDKKFCSEACATVLGIDPIITPGSLYSTLAHRNMITRTI